MQRYVSESTADNRPLYSHSSRSGSIAGSRDTLPPPNAFSNTGSASGSSTPVSNSNRRDRALSQHTTLTDLAAPGFAYEKVYSGSQPSFSPDRPALPAGAAAPNIPGGGPESSEEAAGAKEMYNGGGYGGYSSVGMVGRRQKLGRPILLWSVCAGILIVLVLVIALPVTLTRRSSSNTSSTASPSGSSQPGSPNQPASTPLPTTGGQGSLVYASDGSTFTYNNTFGGVWVYDPDDPFNDGAQAQSWTPRLNETWEWGTDQVRGVNLGGWLVTEPFITPALFEPYQNGSFAPPDNAIDEWTLMVSMDKVGNATALMEQHYETFITEIDFAQIASAGLNFVRIPVPFWMIEVYENEPFVERLAWTYFLRAIQWARKYGLRINMDLHTIPGSQNGWNHSGKEGPINFLFGVMGIANAQRTLSYLRTLAEFVSQPEYTNVVQMFGIVNEPWATTIGLPEVQSFYLEAHDLIRSITGYGEGHGPMIVVHDCFEGQAVWAGFLSGSDRISLDTHPYFAFNTPSTQPIEDFVPSPCNGWGPSINESMTAFGLTQAGEWSVAVNDCGLWLNGVGTGNRWDGTYPGSTTVYGSCDSWNDYSSWNDTIKGPLMQLAYSSMDGLQNWFFWTWKIAPSSITGQIESPMWSYSLGLAEGWIPTDPRNALDYCSASAGVSMTNPVGPFSAWQTGGPGAGTIAPDQISSYGVWPITSMNSATGSSYIPPSDVILLPQYTPTGSPITLPGPTFTDASGSTTAAPTETLSPQDTGGYYEPIAACDYPNQWVAVGVPIPTAGCLPASRKRDLGAAGPTPVARM